MKRRNILKGIVFFTIGGTTIFSCKDKYEAIHSLNLEFLNPSSDQIQIIEQLANAIVPIQSIPALKNHTSLPYILKKVNDCYSEKDRNKFIMGYEKFGEFVNSKLNKSFANSTEEEKMSLLTELNEAKEGTVPEHIAALFGALKSEGLGYLSKTEFIQRQVRYYEMGPARFDGCVPISELKNRNKTNTQNG